MANTLPAATPRIVNNHKQAPRAYLRALIAWAAAALTLAAAVLGALLGGPSGLSLGVSSLAGGATDALQAVGDAVPLGYAFGVGMAAAVNPCGFALLPTYLGLYVGTAAGERRSWPGQLVRAVAVSLAMTASFVALFGLVGLILGAAGEFVGGSLPWLSVAVGVLLLLAGARGLAAGLPALAGPERLADALGGRASRAGLVGYVAYGLAFGLSSLGCSLPLFLAVVGSAIARGGLVAGMGQLVLYAFGMGTAVSTLTLLVSVFGHAVLARARGVGRLLESVGALLLLATGGYIVYYWLSAGGIR